MESVLAVHNVSKSFGNKAILKAVSLEVERGEALGIFGKNGSGKSTLLKILFGILRADSLEATIDGKVFMPSAIIKEKRIGYLPQHHFLPKWPKVRDIIPIYHTSEEKQDLVFYDPGIARITAKRVGQLSLGELKYFECVLVASQSHPILLLDEPFSMLDPLQKDGLRAFLKQMQANKAMIITDHYYEDVLQISTKNIVISEGNSTGIKGKEDLIKLNYLPRK